MRSHPATALEELIGQLDIVGAQDYEAVLFGSVVMYLHELKDLVGGVDVMVSTRVYAELKRRPWWNEQCPHLADPCFLEYKRHGSPAIHAFYDWTKRDSWFDIPRVWRDSERGRVGGWRAITLDHVLDMKQEALAYGGVYEKHRADIALIQAHLERVHSETE